MLVFSCKEKGRFELACMLHFFMKRLRLYLISFGAWLMHETRAKWTFHSHLIPPCSTTSATRTYFWPENESWGTILTLLKFEDEFDVL
jgi:hypothetical protein